MKLLLASLLPLFLALGAPEQLAPGAMRLWLPKTGAATFLSQGVEVTIAPAPCDAAHASVGCSEERVNNRAVVTIVGSDRKPFRFDTRDEYSYYRLAIVRFDGRSAPGVVIENDSGGSGGDMMLQLVAPFDQGYRLLQLPEAGDSRLQNGLPDQLTDLSGDGRIDLVLGDGRFASKFGCNTCTPRPPRVFTYRGGHFVDVSREQPYARILREDMERLRPLCMSQQPGHNGACAAYVADAARIGEFDRAWARMLRYHERDPAKRAGGAEPDVRDSFPELLHGFLQKTGYIS